MRFSHPTFKRLGLLSLTLISCSGLLSSCGRATSPATIKTVEIGQTPVKSQNAIGFCWAYATTGFLEAMFLKKSGQSVDLSEEAIGFYRMAEELYSLSQRYKAAELETSEQISKKTFEDLEGWDLTFNPVYNPGFDARNSLQLVQDFGVVPESVWSYKFLSKEQREAFFDAVFTGFAELVQKLDQSKITRETIYGLLASEKAYGSRPPAEFTYVFPDGKKQTFTAQEFAAYVIGFSPDDYTYMIPDTQIHYDQLVKAVKLSLARGLDVPLSFTIYKDSESDWDASFSAQRLNLENLKVDGGHAVLITDFVNKGGRPGAVPTAALQGEVAKTPSELDFLVIKNSWATQVQSPVLRLPGYFTMDQGYLQLLAKKADDIAIVVPRDIAFQVRYEP